MKPWTADIDPSTIPYEVLKSERSRRNLARRGPTGGVRLGAGIKPTCTCGECQKCKRRAKAKEAK